MPALAYHGSGPESRQEAAKFGADGRTLRTGAPRLPLTRAACRALLAPGGHGRVAGTMRAVPIIIPVRFTFVGDEVIFTIAQGAGLSRAVAHSVVAFETDHIGSDGRALWGVHVTGVARPFADDTSVPTFRLSSEIMTGW